MIRVVVFGIGKSSPYLIKKLQAYSSTHPLRITLVDTNWSALPTDCINHKNTEYLTLDINDIDAVSKLINHQDLIISMLPAVLHVSLAKLCLQHHKNLLTASYVSEEMQQLHKKAQNKGLLFLNEMGVDPGLDHMSALKLIHSLKLKNAEITNFYSHTGGLISNFETNSWNYKFTWNPKNVILAGAEGATYIKNQQKKSISYSDVFKTIISVCINNKSYESYPNRNSTSYAKKYDLNTIDTFYRGTLRHPEYCQAWQVFVELGMTKDNNILHFKNKTTRKDFLNHFLEKKDAVKKTFSSVLDIEKGSSIFKKFELLQFFNDAKYLTLENGTAADILLSILKEEWQMQPNDKDLLLMQHEIHYKMNGKKYISKSELSVIGENQQYTAMAKTVGAPMFEAAILMLNNQIKATGVHIPTTPSIYEPILNGLKKHDLEFLETTEVA